MTTLFCSSRHKEAHSKKMFNARPHPNPLPRGEGTAIADFFFYGSSFGKYSRTIFFETASVSPSPWGEGWGEGGCYN